MRTVIRSVIAAVIVLVAAACSASTDAGGGVDHVEITLHPARTSYPINDTVRAKVTPFSKQGTWTPAASATWRSLTPDIATVDNDGLVHGRSQRGAATIEVEVDGKTAQIVIPFRGILHRGFLLDHNETWLVADTPHVVDLTLDVGKLAGSDTVVLTIEAGSTVRFRPEAGLIFGAVAPAALVIPAGDPVLMDGDAPAGTSPSWRGLLLDQGRLELRNLTLRHCGQDYSFDNPGACLIAASGSLLVDSVTISEGRNGANLGGVQFAPGSRKLSVLNTDGYAVRTAAHLLGEFPRGGQFSGNDDEDIVVTNGRVLSSADWSGLPAPLRISGGVTFEGPANPVLTLPPGMHLRFERGAGLSFATGGIVAGDVSGQPVVLESTGDGWLGMYIEHAAGSALRNFVMQDCGVSQTSPGPSRFEACLVFGPQGGLDSGLIVQDVIVRGSRTAGIYIEGGGTFHPDSRNLTVTQSASYPLQLWGRAAVAIPSGDYRFNDVNAIWVIGGMPDSARLRNVGVPYRFPDGLSIASLLYLDPGVTIQIGVGMTLGTGFGNLVAVGTAAEPIIFTSTTPGVAGSWYGIQMGVASPGPGTRFDHVIIADAGAGSGPTAAVWLGSDPGGLFRNTTFVRSAGCAIVIGNGQSLTDDYTDPAFGNSFVDLAGPKVCIGPY